MQFEPPNMPEIGWFSSTWHPTEDMERFQDSRHKTFTCGFSFPTPVLLSRVQPRAHTFDDNHLISGRTPPRFSPAKNRKHSGMGTSNGTRFWRTRGRALGKCSRRTRQRCPVDALKQAVQPIPSQDERRPPLGGLPYAEGLALATDAARDP